MDINIGSYATGTPGVVRMELVIDGTVVAQDLVHNLDEANRAERRFRQIWEQRTAVHRSETWRDRPALL